MKCLGDLTRKLKNSIIYQHLVLDIYFTKPLNKKIYEHNSEKLTIFPRSIDIIK